MSVSNALQGALMLLCITMLGFYMAKRGYISEKMEGQLSFITIRFAVPCTLIVSCIEYIDKDNLSSMGMLLLIPFATILAGCAVAICLIRLFKLKNAGMFLNMFALSNTIFIGLPVCTAIFGDRAIGLVVTYFPSNMLIFWTAGVAWIAMDASQTYGFDIKQVLSPPLLSAAAGIVLAVIGIEPPPFLMDSLRYVGGLTIPLSLILTGAIISRMGRDVFRLNKESILALAGRMLIMPGLAFGICLVARSYGLMKGMDESLIIGVYTLEAAMPVMNQAVIMARHYNADYKTAAQLLTLTTVITVVWIPLLVFILEKTLI